MLGLKYVAQAVPPHLRLCVQRTTELPDRRHLTPLVGTRGLPPTALDSRLLRLALTEAPRERALRALAAL